MELVDYFVIYFLIGILLCSMLFFAIQNDLDIERSLPLFVSLLLFYPIIIIGLWLYYIIKILFLKD